MTRAIISLGSNIEPQDKIKEALARLGKGFAIENISHVFRTKPEGGRKQPWFLNCSVQVETGKSLDEIKILLKKVEREMGRERIEDKFAQRVIDLDLVIYGDDYIESDFLKIPDPDIYERAYLARTVGELVPDYNLPGSRKNINDLAEELGESELVPLTDFTDLLRREILHEHRL